MSQFGGTQLVRGMLNDIRQAASAPVNVQLARPECLPSTPSAAELALRDFIPATVFSSPSSTGLSLLAPISAETFQFFPGLRRVWNSSGGYFYDAALNLCGIIPASD